ncbi:FAD-dependent oxidoreductase [Bacillus wiedmannii]|uniref:FAD-dependent monooxygenase n=1 Tax=Bacillus TaxID=1386 RepID=UPI0007DAF5E8|nr:FAD-dependent monooxygenase [Bacillus wiedmannii]HDR6298775.1 FAD-dependent monooxygenase [Bacillus cereus]MED2837748.1 FAD-dependent monooxygenase [Bacillus wiedmannii]OAK04211.1 FAD-dependent oxidoreductase [Bacillus wiedmannii]OAK13567.1 FAD-dependent oxidoreductase [Bacillus wiedmannii]OAK26738.1 FAD-dependent oxidoreductase [Bacillus wiedmannii]
MKQAIRVLISGASITGPALAYWLHRYGFDVTVVERAPALRSGGYGVDIRGAAVTVLGRMGILDQVRAADTNMTGVYFVNSKGEVEGQLSEASLANQHGVDIEIMRDDLSNILYDLTKDTIKYIWSESITAIHDNEAGVEVQFIHEKPQTFDLVIGADGLHSNVRSLTFGDEAQFKRTLGCYISIFTLENYLNLDHRVLLYTMPGKTVGMYSARGNTEAKGMLLFQSEALEYDRYDEESQKKLVENAFVDHTEDWETSQILKTMKEANDFYFDEICQIHMPTWSKDRITLVGDAAYGPSPLSGQGTSLALVGAYVLAGELKNAHGDYSRAYVAYEKEMRKFVEKNQKIGKLAAGSMVEKSNFKIFLRNFMLRVPTLMVVQFKIISKMVAKAANGIELKDY